jgi:hypothetical protein
MLRGFDCVQRIPSRSQYSQNNARMSADRFEKNHRGYVLRPPPAGQQRREAVDGPAPVRVQQPAQELPREPIDDLPLPARELDLAVMLAPWPVLREGFRPPLAVSHHANAAPDGIGLRSDSARELHRSHGREALVDQRRVAGVARDHQMTGARMVREMSIAEVQAEEMAVRARMRWPPQRCHEQMFAMGSDGIGVASASTIASGSALGGLVQRSGWRSPKPQVGVRFPGPPLRAALEWQPATTPRAGWFAPSRP